MTGFARTLKKRAGASIVLTATLGLAGVLVAPGRASAAPWTVTPLSASLTPVQLAQTLVGPGIAVNSATFTGDNSAGGTFNDPAASVGLASGIVLSTGDVHDVIGPNSVGNSGEDLPTPGSTQLDALVAPYTTEDAAILDVNFTPKNPQLAINYVFASEEYKEYVGTAYNDVFAFFVNGVNCALTPGTNSPIAVNTVNPGSNALFYVPNEPATYDTQFDGFTVVLTCRAAVTPGVPNTLRLAIADTSDGVWDSAVFLQANGVSSNPLGPLQPITPNRLLDTRFASPTGLSASSLSPQAIIPAGQSISLKVTGGEVPESALAVALNVTAVDAAAGGFITIYADGAAQPNTSSVNFTPGEASPNAVLTRIGAGGRVRIFASVNVNVIVDVFGWFGTGGRDRLFTVVPDRVMDTRFPPGAPVAAGAVLNVQVAGTLRVPVGATAAVLNVTATGAAGPGFLTVYPSDKPTPNVSAVNFLAGDARPNTVIAPLGADGKIKIFASEKTDVIVDVMGWFGNAGQTEYVEVPSQRLFDSRQAINGGAKIGAGQKKDLLVVGQFVPPNARSVVLNVTIAEPDASGFATVYPGGAPQPNTSNLNYRAGQTIPNAVIVGLGPTGTVTVFTSSSAHLLVDVVGYFA